MIRVKAEPVNPTTRRYPRTLKDAFPVSENRRSAIETPPPRMRISDRVRWALAIATALYLVTLIRVPH